MTSPSRKRAGLVIATVLATGVFIHSSHAETPKMDHPSLAADLARIVQAQPQSRVGVCVTLPEHAPACVNGDARFSLQSVVKLFVGAAMLDAIENGQFTLEQTVTLSQRDMSVYQHPLAELIAQNGTYTTTIKDLMARAINDSDNAACDKLIEMLGGAQQVQSFLAKKGVTGIHVDRDEKNLQAEINGLQWRDEFTDQAAFKAASAAVPPQQQDAAYSAYQKDIRDTAEPRAAADFLSRLASGNLLSADSTATLMDILLQTRTGTDRLRAGLAEGWQLANKTGTSTTHKGTAAATNDIGILIAPDGARIPVAVFVADSTASPDDRAALMARIAASAIAHHGK